MAAPIDMPENFFQSAKFDLHEYVSGNMLKGGRTQVVQQAEPRWVADFTTGLLDETKMRKWRSFVAKLRGGRREFLAYDPAQEFPLAYPGGLSALTRAGGGSFTSGQVGVTAISETSITLGSGAGGAAFPASFQISEGDVFGLVNGTIYGRYVVTGGPFTASGGGSMTINSFEPRILTTLFTTGATAVFWRPGCAMTIDPTSWDFKPTGGTMVPASFTGIQRLY
jgi:hypothetical protein